MATLTIRNLPDDVQQSLRERAARRGRSMEAEVRDILGRAVQSGQQLSEQEKKVLSPKAQAALARLRGVFAVKSGETKESLVDDFLAQRRTEWGED